jgi:hypothetical protein
MQKKQFWHQFIKNKKQSALGAFQSVRAFRLAAFLALRAAVRSIGAQTFFI